MDSRSLMALVKAQTKQRPSRGGMSDTVPGMIKETGEPVMVSEGEFIIPADIVSLLGDGSNEEGARILTDFMKKVRMEKGKHLAKGKQAKKFSE